VFDVIFVRKQQDWAAQEGKQQARVEETAGSALADQGCCHTVPWQEELITSSNIDQIQTAVLITREVHSGKGEG